MNNRDTDKDIEKVRGEIGEVWANISDLDIEMRDLYTPWGIRMEPGGYYTEMKVPMDPSGYYGAGILAREITREYATLADLLLTLDQLLNKTD